MFMTKVFRVYETLTNIMKQMRTSETIDLDVKSSTFVIQVRQITRRKKVHLLNFITKFLMSYMSFL